MVSVCERDLKRETEARLWGFGIIMANVNICLVFIERMNRVVRCRLYRNLGSGRTRRETEGGSRRRVSGKREILWHLDIECCININMRWSPLVVCRGIAFHSSFCVTLELCCVFRTVFAQKMFAGCLHEYSETHLEYFQPGEKPDVEMSTAALGVMSWCINAAQYILYTAYCLIEVTSIYRLRNNLTVYIYVFIQRLGSI